MKILTYPQAEAEINLKRKSIWNHTEVLDALQQHNLCFCPKTVPSGKSPDDDKKQHFLFSLTKKKYTYTSKMIYSKNDIVTYITSIVMNSEIRSRQFRFAKAFMSFKSLIQLLCKCFMCRPRQNTEMEKQFCLSNLKRNCFIKQFEPSSTK